MQVVTSRGGRQTLRFAPRWAVEPVELTDGAVDELESRLRAATAERVLELLANATIDEEIYYVGLYGDPIQYYLVYATERDRRAVWARRRYRPFDFYLHEALDCVNEDLPDRGFADLIADWEVLKRKLIKRREQPRLDGFTAQVARILNAGSWPANLHPSPGAVVIAHGVGGRKDGLRAMRESVSRERWAALEDQENINAADHAATHAVPSIRRSSAKTKLLELAHEAGYTARAHDAMTPRQLFEAFVRFIDMPITGVEQEHDDALFEVHSADPHGDVEVRLVRQLRLHDRDENYLGVETISIELLFSPPPSDRPTNETIWADHDRSGTWANDVRASNGFGFLLANQHGPHTVWISQGGV